MITADQRTARQKYIGSSDAAAILGLDPYRSAYDVWLDKTSRVEGFAGNDATDAGNYLERAVLDWAESQVAPFRRDVMKVSPGGSLAANFDGLGIGDSFVVEAKTTGIVGPANAAYGEITDGPGVELPDGVIVQVHHQFLVAGRDCEIGYVPVLIGGQGFRMYQVTRTAELCDMVEEAACNFMIRHVATDTPPGDSKPSLDVLRRMRRQPNKTISIPDEIAESWIVSRAARLDAEKAEKETQAALLAAMADAEAAEFSGGTITYLETKRATYAVEACSYRTLRIKKAK